MSGRLDELGDVMMQRLKAVVQSVYEGGWQTARHLEVIPPGEATLVPQRELEAAAKAEMRAAKLRGLLEDAKHRRRPPGAE